MTKQEAINRARRKGAPIIGLIEYDDGPDEWQIFGSETQAEIEGADIESIEWVE